MGDEETNCKFGKEKGVEDKNIENIGGENAKSPPPPPECLMQSPFGSQVFLILDATSQTLHICGFLKWTKQVEIIVHYIAELVWLTH